tara:strand:- start:295 stop:768 length:474 start_codon:yes stop_codon:yes gene_type:complete
MVIDKLRFDELKEVKEIRDYCLEYLNDSTSFTLDETKKWFETTNPEWYTIRVQDRDRMAGYIRTSEYDNKNNSIFIGLDLHPNFRGYGYAFQAYQKIMEKLKVEKNIRRFYLEVQVSNFRAYNLYRKLGFNSIGIIPEKFYQKDKGFIDVILMYKNS